jgi:anaerobic ribonucleoside-triphosphate reductase activating protein
MNLLEIWKELSEKDNIQGITISGGEPFLYPIELSMLCLCARAFGLDIVIYTGYTWEELIDLSQDTPGIISTLIMTDLLVDGPFVEAEKDLDIPFRGSRNQRLIRASESINENKVILWDPDKEAF